MEFIMHAFAKDGRNGFTLRASLVDKKVEKKLKKENKKEIFIYREAHKLSLSIAHFFWAPPTFISHHYLIYL